MGPLRTLLAASLVVGPALAGEVGTPGIVSPEEFRDYAQGWTLYFERDGVPFGSEHFAEDGRTRWRYNDGSCVRGVWRPYGAQLCFLYDSDATAAPLCWRMLRDEKGLFARLLDGDTPGLELRVARRDRAPLLCGEPGRST